MLAPVAVPHVCPVTDHCVHASQPWYAVHRPCLQRQQQGYNTPSETARGAAVLHTSQPGTTDTNSSASFSRASEPCSGLHSIAHALDLLGMTRASADSLGKAWSTASSVLTSSAVDVPAAEDSALVIMEHVDISAVPGTPASGQQAIGYSIPLAPIRPGPSVILVPAAELSNYV